MAGSIVQPGYRFIRIKESVHRGRTEKSGTVVSSGKRMYRRVANPCNHPWNTRVEGNIV